MNFGDVLAVMLSLNWIDFYDERIPYRVVDHYGV